MLEEIRNLRKELREKTKQRYNRVNPFCEDLFDWKEKGEFCGGKDVTIYDSVTVIGEVILGDYCWIGPYCSIDGTGKLEIGEYTTIAAGCQILTHDTVRYTLSGGKNPYGYSATHIGKCCFVGTHSIILKGTKLGDHCLVGANSLVSGEFGSFSILAGVPAKQIGTVIIEEDKILLDYFER